MSGFDKHANLIKVTVTVAPSPATSGITLSISNTDATALTTAGLTAPFNMVAQPTSSATETNVEIIRVTAIGAADSGGTGNTQLTITRTAETQPGSARSILVGDYLTNNATTKVYTDLENNLPPVNLMRNGNFINNSTNGYGGLADDWIDGGTSNSVQGGFPTFGLSDLLNAVGVANANVQGLWNLNGVWTDQSSNAATLTPTNAPTFSSDGLMGQAASFASTSSQYATTTTVTNLKITGNKTIIAYITPSSIADSYPLGLWASTGGFYHLHMTASGTIGLEIGGLSGYAYSNVVLQANKKYMIVAVYDSTNTQFRIYINDVKSTGAPSGTETAVTATNFSVGQTGNNTANYWNGKVENVVILNTALTDTQVQSLWALTTYKGQKIRASGAATYIYQTLNQDQVERLRGQSLTVAAEVAQDTASSAAISIYDGVTETVSSTFTGLNSYQTVSATQTIASNATQIQIRVKVLTTTGNVWAKQVRLVQGLSAPYYIPSLDDISRFPRLLAQNPPAEINGYRFEENRIYVDVRPNLTGYTTTPNVNTIFSFRGNQCYIYHVDDSNGGTSNAATITYYLPILPYSVQTIYSNGIGYGRDNGSNLANPIQFQPTSGNMVITVYKSFYQVGFTTSGGKAIFDMNGAYQIQ